MPCPQSQMSVHLYDCFVKLHLCLKCLLYCAQHYSVCIHFTSVCRSLVFQVWSAQRTEWTVSCVQQVFHVTRPTGRSCYAPQDNILRRGSSSVWPALWTLSVLLDSLRGYHWHSEKHLLCPVLYVVYMRKNNRHMLAEVLITQQYSFFIDLLCVPYSAGLARSPT